MNDQTESHTHLHGRWLFSARVAWVTVVMLSMIVYAAAAPVAFHTLATPCNFEPCMSPFQARPNAEVTPQELASLEFGAWYHTILEAVLRLLTLSVALFIFWHRSDDWMALLASIMLVATFAVFSPSPMMLETSQPLWQWPIILLRAIGLASTVGLFYLLPDGRFVPRWTRWLAIALLLLIGAFALFVVDLTTISRDLLPAGIHFLIILLNVKLMTLQNRRDYRHLYAISLMAVLASAALTTDLWYVSVFVLYGLAAVWSLLLYHLTGRTAACPPLSASGADADPAASLQITGRFFWLTNGIAVSTFALTLLIFFLLPRISIGILQKPQGEGLRTTGFSERVDLGMIGSVKEDPQIVMRIELPDQEVGSRERFYLRGLAYDQYNGRSWSSGNRQRRSLGLVADGIFAFRSGCNRSLSSLSESLLYVILI